MSQLYKRLANITSRHIRSNLPAISLVSSTQIQSNLSTATSDVVTEKDIKDLLQTRFQDAKEIVVEDVSGGCGAMFNVYVATSEFRGLSIVKQHKAITETLKEQIKKIHGLRIETEAT